VQAAWLHAGEAPEANSLEKGFSTKILCNLYLDPQESWADDGEIRPRQISDRISLLRGFVKFFGPDRLVSDVSAIELQKYGECPTAS